MKTILLIIILWLCFICLGGCACSSCKEKVELMPLLEIEPLYVQSSQKNGKAEFAMLPDTSVEAKVFDSIPTTAIMLKTQNKKKNLLVSLLSSNNNKDVYYAKCSDIQFVANKDITHQKEEHLYVVALSDSTCKKELVKIIKLNNRKYVEIEK